MKQIQKWKCAVVAIILGVMCGCSKNQPLTVNEVSGVYRVAYKHGTEILELREDGTYTQRYLRSSDQSLTVNSGKWTIDQVGEDIDLYDALMFDTGSDERREPPLKTGWSLKIIRSSGRIQMPIDSDRALMFEKQ